jgi:hypothetical protein
MDVFSMEQGIRLSFCKTSELGVQPPPPPGTPLVVIRVKQSRYRAEQAQRVDEV